MAGKSDIEAGRAFVRLFLKNDLSKALAGALKSGGESLKTFGQGVMKAGAGVSAVGGAMLAPIIAGVKTFMDMGGAAVDAAARTGLSVEALSELGFAAEQTGASLGTVEVAVKKMAGEIQNLTAGSKASAERFAELGLTLADLQGLSPDEQFSKIGQAIAAIQDPTMRAAAAVDMFGRSGTQLLPMLGDMEALRKKARDLGIVMSTEDANAADDLGDAWDALKAQGKTIFFQIGAAVAGPLKAFAGRAAEMAKRAIDWAKANGPLIATFAKVAVGVSVAGAALVAIGGAIAGLGFVLTGAATVVSAMGTALGLLLSPVGLITAALVAGAVGWMKYTDSGKAAWQGLVAAVLPIVETIKAAFGGIWTALKAGDWQTAMEIAFAGLQVAAAQGLDILRSLVGDTLGNIAGQFLSGDFSGAWASAVDGMALIWESFAAGVVNTFTGAADAVIGAWLKAVTFISDSILKLAQDEGIIGDAMAKVLGVDLRGMQGKNDQRAFEGKRQSILLMEDQVTEAKAAGDTAKVADLEARLKIARDQLGSGQYGAAQAGNPFDDARKAAAGILEQQVAGARAGLAQARKDAAARQAEAAGRFVGGQAAAGAGLDAAGKAAEAKLAALLLEQQTAGYAAEFAAAMEGGGGAAAVTPGAPGAGGGPGAPGAGGGPGEAPPPITEAVAKDNRFAGLTTYSAAAAQAIGFGGAGGGGGPAERTAKGIDRLAKLVEDQKAAVLAGNLSFEKLNATWERYITALSYG